MVGRREVNYVYVAYAVRVVFRSIYGLRLREVYLLGLCCTLVRDGDCQTAGLFLDVGRGLVVERERGIV